MTATEETVRRVHPDTVRRVFREGDNRPGRLVTVVGFDGSGKTTQIESLSAALRAAGHEVVETRQPTDWYRRLTEVQAFHSAGGSVETAHILALLAAADRRRHVLEVVEPALARGAWVLCDRYVYATYGVFVHRGVDAEFLTTANNGIPRPDHAFYLEVPTEELQQRLRARDGANLQFEEKSADRIGSILRSYEEMEDELVVVDGSAPADEITAKLLTHLSVGRGERRG
jgi:dTMP kinase